MEESQAIALLKQNELRGLEFLVRRYQVQAVQAAYLVVGDRSLAEDIVQSAFLKAAVKIDRFDSSRSFGPWFLRMVIHDSIKANGRARRQVSLDAQAEQAVPPEWLADPGAGPEELADNAETRQVVWAALEQLTPKQRAAVVMHYFMEMKDREISQALERPLSAVKWSLHAARQRLRDLLKPLSAVEGRHSDQAPSGGGQGKR